MLKSKTDKKDLRGVFRMLRPYLSRERQPILISALLSILTYLVILWGPVFSGRAIDAMGFGGEQVDFPLSLRMALLFFLSYLLHDSMAYLTRRKMGRVSQNIGLALRQDCFNKIVELPLSYLDAHQAGDLVSRISYDLDLVSSAIFSDLTNFIATTITVFGSLWMMFRISVDLSLIFLLLLPFTAVFTWLRIKKMRPLFSLRSRKLGQMNGHVEEILYGQKSIRAYEQEDYFLENFNAINTASMEAYYQAEYQAAINWPSVSLMTNIGLALIAIFGSFLYLNGSFTLGELSAFVLLSRRFSGPINEMANLIAELQSALSAAERVRKLLEQPSEPADLPGAKSLVIRGGEVRFQNVSFSYKEGEPVIKNLSFTATAGSMTAIVGPTGAGKTTLINLLMRFYDPDEGQILIDAQDTRSVQRGSLRRSFAMVLQDSWLFKGSIRDNIAYGKPDASIEEIKEAATAAHIASDIEAMPDAYETEISDGAENISEGQQQLLTIARAMLLDTPLLILDEATSHVDSRTEYQIQQAMDRLIEGRTSFVIAHRLSTIRHADRILLIMDGEVAEEGSHEELLKKGGAYAKLYEAQFS